MEFWTQILNCSVFIWVRKLREGWKKIFQSGLRTMMDLLYSCFSIFKARAVGGANTMTIAGEELALQLPTLVLCWFM